MSIFSSFFKKDKVLGTDPQIMTKEVVDPLKQKVASPLSAYLEKEVGKPLPRSDGTLAEPVNTYSEFLGQAGDFFDKSFGDPATSRFKRDFQPLIDEGYAGNLRGSGRFGANEDAYNRFSEDLAVQKSTFAAGEAKTIWAIKDTARQREYEDWWRSLPQNNPVLTQALQFLSDGTSSGTTVLSALDPGKQGWLQDLLKAAVTGISSSTGSGGAAGGAK